MITRTDCRVCDGPLHFVMTLGDHYVSDFPSIDEGDGTKAPLELVICERCTLLQLKHTVPAETMYRNYWYRSGTNRTMCEALADIAHKAERLIHLRGGDTVLDIGCNDGTLLGSYRTLGIYRIGFDPARNLAAYSTKIADTVVSTFFGAEASRRSRRSRAVGRALSRASRCSTTSRSRIGSSPISSPSWIPKVCGSFR